MHFPHLISIELFFYAFIGGSCRGHTSQSPCSICHLPLFGCLESSSTFYPCLKQTSCKMLICFGGVCVPLNMLVPFIVGESSTSLGLWQCPTLRNRRGSDAGRPACDNLFKLPESRREVQAFYIGMGTLSGYSHSGSHSDFGRTSGSKGKRNFLSRQYNYLSCVIVDR